MVEEKTVTRMIAPLLGAAVLAATGLLGAAGAAQADGHTQPDVVRAGHTQPDAHGQPDAAPAKAHRLSVYEDSKLDGRHRTLGKGRHTVAGMKWPHSGRGMNDAISSFRKNGGFRVVFYASATCTGTSVPFTRTKRVDHLRNLASGDWNDRISCILVH